MKLQNSSENFQAPITPLSSESLEFNARSQSNFDLINED